MQSVTTLSVFHSPFTCCCRFQLLPPRICPVSRSILLHPIFVGEFPIHAVAPPDPLAADPAPVPADSTTSGFVLPVHVTLPFSTVKW